MRAHRDNRRGLFICLLLLSVTEDSSFSDPCPLAAGRGETSWPAEGREKAVRSPDSAVQAVKIPSFPLPQNKETPTLQPLGLSLLFSILTPSSRFPHAHPSFQHTPSQGYVWRTANVPHQVALGDVAAPERAAPHAALPANWPSQKRLCAMAWSRDAWGLRSPEGPSQDPPCSPGQEGVCSGGRCQAMATRLCSHAAHPPPVCFWQGAL